MSVAKSGKTPSHPIRRLVRSTFAGLIVVCVSSFAQNAYAATCDLADYQSSVRPDPPGTPTEVTIGLTLVDLAAISDIDQTVTLDALLTLQWTDRRLDAATGCRYDYSTIWTPEIQLFNSAVIESRQLPQLLVEPDGRVITTVRYNVTMSSPANIADFPFDRRSILMQIGSLHYDASDLPFRIAESWSGRLEEPTIPDWKIGEPTADVTQLVLPRIEREVSVLEFRIPASRLSDYYIYKFVFPLCLIVFMSWLVFWIDPSNLSPQLALAGTSMLTLIAFQFTVNDLLPRVGYLTSMDQYVLSSSLLVFLALVEAMVSGRLASNGRVAAAEMLDRVSRWAFPATYLVVIVVTLVL